MTSPENASFLLRIQRTGSILLHITIDIKIRLLHPCNPKNHCNDDSMIRHRPRGKVWKKIGDTIFRSSVSSLFFLHLLSASSSSFFFSPSTVESKTIGYLECPREHSSFDTDSQVWWLDRLHVSLFERISMAHGQRFDSRRKRICRFWHVSFLLKDYVLLFEFSHDMWKCCSSERVESSWGCNAW